MSSIAWRSSVPGAIRPTAASRSRVEPRIVLRGLPDQAEALWEPGRPYPPSARSASIAALAACLSVSASRTRSLPRALRAGRRDRGREAELGALLEPALGLRRGTQAAGEADLAERRRSRASTGAPFAAEAIASAIARSAPGSSIRTPPATLTKTSAWPSAIPACRESTATIIASRFGSTPVPTRLRHREVGRRDERLDLEQHRPRPLERAGDGGADLALDGAAEELRRLGHADEPGAGHLEDGELVRRAEAVLRRAQDAMLVVAVALELEHAVDEVLEHARAGDRPVLRHVADEDRGDARLLRHAQQPATPPRAPARPSRAPSRAPTSRASAPSRSRRRPAAPARASRRRRRARSRPGSRPPRRRRAARRGASPARPTPRRSRAARDARRSTAARTHRSSVDLPTPGSPPTRTSDAGTSPPPSTRSSSGTPVAIRFALLGRDVDESHRRPGRGRLAHPAASPRAACRTRRTKGTCRTSGPAA